MKDSAFLKHVSLIILLPFAISNTLLAVGTGKRSALISQADDSENARVAPDRIVVKFKDNLSFGKKFSRTGEKSFDSLLQNHRISSLEQVVSRFPNLQNVQTSVAIGSIYYAKINDGESPHSVARSLSGHPLVEYAEPIYYHKILDTPNDPSFSQQTYHSVIQAEAAWDIVKGEQGNVVVAIVDGGTDIDHPDLVANLWQNPGEVANNGIDDDANGFIDDVNGWNFANNSNDPTGLEATPLNANHGTQTAGIACAVSNNSFGIAGTSWNATLMPINVANPTDDFKVAFTTDGVLYAANNGADIVNLSLGRDGPALSFEQDLYNMVHEMGIVVVASAGNGGNSTPNYPASYDNVVSVAATNNSDQKAGFSQFGVHVDISAPGVNILSLLNGGGVQSFGDSGTSFCTPIVAGVAALVKTQHPNWTPTQVSEQVRLTADNIDALNPSFAGLLGRGRVNAFRAVTETVPAVRISNIQIVDTGGNNDGSIQAGEFIELRITFINHLAPAANVNFTLSENDPLITLTNGAGSIAALGTLETTVVSFSFNVSTVAPGGRQLNFTLDISSDALQDKEIFTLLVESEFITLAINNVDLSLTNFGRIGFGEPFEGAGGVGFTFNSGPSLLFEGAIIAGTGPDRISNAARGIIPSEGQPHILNKDFSGTEDGDLQVIVPGVLTDQESFAAYRDDRSNTPMNIKISQESFAMRDAPNDDFIILRFTVENENTIALDNFHFGLFYDWDVEDFANNLADFDASRNLGHVSFGSTFVGVKLLSSENVTYRAFDNNGANFSINGGDGFTDNEKWATLSNGTTFSQAGPADISHVIGAGPFNIEPNDFIQIDFAMLAGTGLPDLQANADAAQALHNSLLLTSVEKDPTPIIPTAFSLKQNYPNPFNPTTFIRFEIPKESRVQLIVYNMLGQNIRTLIDSRRSAGFYSTQWDGKNDFEQQVASGLYLYQLKAGDFQQTQKMLLLR